MSRGARALLRRGLDKRSVALHLASTFCGHGAPMPPADHPRDAEEEDDDLPDVPPALIDPPPERRIQIGPLDCAPHSQF